MSTERSVVNVGKLDKAMTLDDMITETGEKNKELLSKAERKRQLAQVLERGKVIDRLTVDLPPDLHGEWVLNDEVEVARYEAMGFQIDTQYAKKRRLHSEGDSKSIVGDVVFMTQSMEDHLLLEEVKRERYDAAHNPSKQKEEKEFSATVQANTPEIPVIDDSKSRQARKAQIEEAISAKQS